MIPKKYGPSFIFSSELRLDLQVEIELLQSER